ncbi:MAG: DNA gyrase subunit B [Gemmataceae bacterium]|nr:DNA gyrase subunit B [Gemmata sp.]MDW8198271.1 DNA gyrase subunit B [Gemmataceae bacterium]
MSNDTLGMVAYTEENMKTLKDAAHIRQNPGMYVGNTDIEGLHHLVYEIVYNSVDEALAGFCRRIDVTIHRDGSITVADDGRGIPVGIKKDTGKSTLEEALTVAGTSGKFDNAAYRVSAGLHGMGAKAMNALSEWCEAEVHRDGRVWRMEFERGYATSELQDTGPAPAGRTGTTITFKPDPEIFGTLTFDYEKLANRFQQIAFLNKGLVITIKDERDGRTDTFVSEKGIPEYVAFLNAGEEPEHPPIYINKQVDGVTVEVCLQYTTGESKLEMCFTNNAYNKDGGTHLSGFRAGLTRAIGNYGKRENIFKDLDIRGDDFREGLTAVISIGHPDPSFESQTKVKLTTPEVEGLVASVVYEALQEYLEKNPKDAKRICEKVRLTAEARIAAKKARDAVKERKNALSGGGLPGKLYDCTSRERDKSELFLVEGDSAGGSAESGRNRMFQAILPLRGKVLNVEKARLEKLLDNNEISALIAAIGIDIDNVEDVSNVRYGKIIIMTDADVDGQHIRTLLLTFFFRQMRKLIEAGHVYIARPPLFKVTQKKETRFIQTREEMLQELTARGLKGTTLHITPPQQAAKTVRGDELAELQKLVAEAETSILGIERRGKSLDDFLALAVEGTLPVYQVHLRESGRDHWFRNTEEVSAFKAQLAEQLGREPVPGEDYTLDEWHDVKALNRVLAKLKSAGFEASDLVPLPRIAGREPPVRFALEHEGTTKPLASLRELVAEIRRLGEKGISITRFKGLGEMDPEELWATTLDPAHRTLMQVTLNDAFKAEEMFRTLMGKEVHERREFIFKNSLKSVEEIDYGA